MSSEAAESVLGPARSLPRWLPRRPLFWILALIGLGLAGASVWLIIDLTEASKVGQGRLNPLLDTLSLGQAMVLAGMLVIGSASSVLTANLVLRFWRGWKWRELGVPSRLSVAVAHGFWLFIPGLAAWAFFVEPNWIETSVLSLDVGLGRRLRIVQLSDLHIESQASRERQIPEIVNGLKPDIVLFTGDYANRTSALPAVTELAGRIEAKRKFAVLGNWDKPPAADALSRGGVTVLRDQAVEIPEAGVAVAGLDVFPTRSLDQILAGRPSRVVIALHHAPEGLDAFGTQEPSLFLCGHTHGGQIRLPVYGAVLTMSRYLKQYEAGLYKRGGTWIYVNRGVGLSGAGPRARFLCRPEVAVFDLR